MYRLWPLNLLSLLFSVRLLSYSLSLGLRYILNRFSSCYSPFPYSIDHSSVQLVFVCLPFFSILNPTKAFGHTHQRVN